MLPVIHRNPWPHQGGEQLIGTGYGDTARLRVSMIRGQRTAPRKGIGLTGLPWGKRDTGRVLAAAIIDRVTELYRPTRAVRHDINGSLVSHSQVRTAGYARN